MTTLSISRPVALVAALLVLSGCSGGSQDEVRQWMNEQRSTVRPKIEPISEPKRFVPQAYVSAEALSPFSSEKLARLLRAEAGKAGTSALLAPELNRRKEPLEALPLDTMNMVGLLDKSGQKVALVRAGTLLYQVRVGNYLGQNYGRVTRINETEITLREIVQDASGEWIERPATLQLQEGTRK